MDKFNLVRNGVSRLPPGFRFQPTDEELVFQYLKCKVFSLPLPASIIPEINVCKYDPWDLPASKLIVIDENNSLKYVIDGSEEQERYFYSYKEAKYPNGDRMNRTTHSGYWKATGSDNKISSSRKNDIAGVRKTLVFYEGKSPNGSRTDWIMHEYRLVSACNLGQQKKVKEIGDWVLCRVVMKNRSAEIGMHKQKMGGGMKVESETRIFFDFMMVNDRNEGAIHSRASSSCSSSSGITEVSATVFDV